MTMPGNERIGGSMADNIESWSRTRRASAHSITMSSDNSSCAGSIGPSSFTENLTLYMNGGREYVPSSTNMVTAEPSKQLGEAQTEHPHGDSGDVQALKDELQATLNRHEELMTENARLSEELKQSITSNKNSNDLATKADAESEFELSNQEEYDQIIAQNARLKKQVEEVIASQLESQELRSRLQQSDQAVKDAGLRTEAVQQQAKAHLSLVQELERRLEEQADLLKTSQDREANSKREIQGLRQEVEALETNGRKELDDQSLIEELEDDLERTCLQLDRVIKDKTRAERQVEFVQSDLKFERSRNEELAMQLALARDSTAMPQGTGPGVLTSNNEDPISSHEIKRLDNEIERASVRIKLLETKLADVMPTNQGFNDQTPAQRIDNLSEDRAMQQSTTAMERAEAYIRKFKSEEKGLKADLKDTQLERDDLRLQLRQSEDAHHASLRTIDELRIKIERLEDIKERMGRVLMYQWGKEEVGEIERARKDGVKERGMGYRYKYFNKDGNFKQTMD